MRPFLFSSLSGRMLTMSRTGSGRVTFLLLPAKNDQGQYFKARTNLKGTIDLSSKMLLAYPQPDGSLRLEIEEFDPEMKHKLQKKD